MEQQLRVNVCQQMLSSYATSTSPSVADIELVVLHSPTTFIPSPRASQRLPKINMAVRKYGDAYAFQYVPI
jgi:hypothetical protein